ncbi:MAG TPA: tripartite tricarboxylate transporter substrate binding protein [Xanthobacteraceae bacterium]|nr:tripartite tricarboxylate transporter substrate binding protein [Xanthobacteraceae bacterium]
MHKILVLVAAGAALFATAPAQAQADYPNKPIKVVVTVPPGGGVDTVTRLLTDQMRHTLGQPFVIENKGGAGGNLAAEMVYTADPDGYTIMASQPAPITTNAVLYKKLNFDPTKFEPIAIMSTIPNVLLVKNDFPAKTLAEFMAYVKSNPGSLNYASQGPGTTSHLTAELFNKIAGTKLVHVPYKGTGPALNDLVAGHVDLIFMQLESALRLHQGGKARILGVCTEKRVAALPDIPTLTEVGLKDFISDTWNALSAPPKTPAPIIAKLNAAVNAALKTPEVQDKFHKLNLTPGGGSPQDMARIVKADTERWSGIIRSLGLKVE